MDCGRVHSLTATLLFVNIFYCIQHPVNRRLIGKNKNRRIDSAVFKSLADLNTFVVIEQVSNFNVEKFRCLYSIYPLQSVEKGFLRFSVF
jgi:hypothetical protein